MGGSSASGERMVGAISETIAKVVGAQVVVAVLAGSSEVARLVALHAVTKLASDGAAGVIDAGGADAGPGSANKHLVVGASRTAVDGSARLVKVDRVTAANTVDATRGEASGVVERVESIASVSGVSYGAKTNGVSGVGHGTVAGGAVGKVASSGIRSASESVSSAVAGAVAVGPIAAGVVAGGHRAGSGVHVEGKDSSRRADEHL